MFIIDGSAITPVVNVVDAGDGPVAVERDSDEVQDGRGATEHVERYPGVAEQGTSRGIHESHIRKLASTSVRTLENATRHPGVTELS